MRNPPRCCVALLVLVTAGWVASVALAAKSSSVAAPTLTVSVNGDFVNRELNAVVGILTVLAKTGVVSVPSGPSYSSASFSFSTFSPASHEVFFQSAATLNLTFSSVALAVPATTYNMSGCVGSWNATVSAPLVSVGLELAVNADGKLQIAGVLSGPNPVPEVTIQFTDAASCDPSETLQMAITAAIDGAVTTAIPARIGGIVELLANGVLKKAEIPFYGQPFASAGDFLSFDVNLLSAMSSAANMPLEKKSVRPLVAKEITTAMPALPPRDIALSIEDDAVTALLSVLGARGMLNLNHTFPGNKVNTSLLEILIPRAYRACPQCPFDIAFFSPNGAVVSFAGNGGNASVTFTDAFLAIQAVPPKENPGTDVPAEILEFKLNFTIQLSALSIIPSSNSTASSGSLFFQIAVPEFQAKLAHAMIGPVTGAQVTQMVAQLLEKELPAFNAGFKGIPLGNLTISKGVTLEQPALAVSQGWLSFAANLDIQSTTHTDELGLDGEA